MKLVRLAMMMFDPFPAKWEAWRIELGPVTVETMGRIELDKDTALVVSGTIELTEMPEISEGGLLVVPEEPRKSAELAIETAANLIAISTRCSRRISSPSPFIAFVPDEESRTLFDNATGIKSESVMIPILNVDIDTNSLPDLAGRIDGIALLAEALSNSHASGRYRELVRFFERAFDCNYKQLPQRLGQFLSRADLGYTSDEVRMWIFELRDPLTHGGRDDLLMESDVRPVIHRMEQAAYDVLFNKAEWRTQEAKRRDVWKPAYGTLSGDGPKFFLTRGLAATMGGTLLDPFRAFPMALHSLKHYPEEWVVIPVSSRTPGGTLYVKPGPLEQNVDAEKKDTDP